MSGNRFLVICGILFVGGGFVQEAAGAVPGAQKLHLFQYPDVQLLDGPLKAQLDASTAFYTSIPNDDLLRPFREQAGLPAPGTVLGGWYGGHAFGQIVSGLARTQAGQPDKTLEEKVDYLVSEYSRCLEGALAKNRCPGVSDCYSYDKMLVGLMDAHTWAGCDEALECLRALVDWGSANLARSRNPNHVGDPGAHEWYTLSENLYDAAALLEDPAVERFASEYHYDGFWTPLAQGEDLGITSPSLRWHAYSHVNSLCSAVRSWEATRNAKYLAAAVNGWDFLVQTQSYATGGWGPMERLRKPGSGALHKSLTRRSPHRSFETPCGAYASIKLDRYLLKWTGLARYADHMEKLIYNGALAALPPRKDGVSFYYSDYTAGARKRYIDAYVPKWAWTCCIGTYSQVISDYPLNVYATDADGLYVLLTTPSRVEWTRADGIVTLTQTTAFPNRNSTRLAVSAPNPVEFNLHIRVPAWAVPGTTVTVNGKHRQTTAEPGSFVCIHRQWRDGDVVEVRQPLGLRFEPIDSLHPNCVALAYGPIVLVAIADGPTQLDGDIENPDAWIKRTNPGELVFETGKVVFRPFHEITTERYTMYHGLRPE